MGRLLDSANRAVSHIAAWQYAVAENLCAFMIAQNKKGYVAVINGVKDGQSIDESLESLLKAAEVFEGGAEALCDHLLERLSPPAGSPHDDIAIIALRRLP